MHVLFRGSLVFLEYFLSGDDERCEGISHVFELELSFIYFRSLRPDRIALFPSNYGCLPTLKNTVTYCLSNCA